jgi:chemotaxis protein histidine kinase CheA
MKKKLISRVAAAVGMCAAVAVVIPAVSVLNMFRSVSIAAEPSDVSSSSEAASESADAWDQLLTDTSNSEFASVIELVAEEKAALEEAAASEEAAESTSASSTSADNNSSSAASSSKAASKASSTGQTAAQEPTASHPAASSSSSSAPTPQNECDAQLAQYLLQMEKLQKKFQSQLYSVICDAYDEYMKYPAEKHSLGLKVSIVVSKGGKLTSMQSACDKEFNALLSEMRTCLRENGRDQSLADNAQKAYESAKASMVKELKNVVYNTAVGNGSGASWIQSHRNMA